MKTLNDIFQISLNLAFPFLLINLLIIMDFFINGSGMQSENDYERNKWFWIGAFTLSGLLHLFLFQKYFKSNKTNKNLLLALILLTYFYIGYKYFCK